MLLSAGMFAVCNACIPTRPPLPRPGNFRQASPVSCPPPLNFESVRLQSPKVAILPSSPTVNKRTHKRHGTVTVGIERDLARLAKERTSPGPKGTNSSILGSSVDSTMTYSYSSLVPRRSRFFGPSPAFSTSVSLHPHRPPALGKNQKTTGE
jgi:hypothetical protein